MDRNQRSAFINGHITWLDDGRILMNATGEKVHAANVIHALLTDLESAERLVEQQAKSWGAEVERETARAEKAEAELKRHRLACIEAEKILGFEVDDDDIPRGDCVASLLRRAEEQRLDYDEACDEVEKAEARVRELEDKCKKQKQDLLDDAALFACESCAMDLAGFKDAPAIIVCEDCASNYTDIIKERDKLMAAVAAVRICISDVDRCPSHGDDQGYGELVMAERINAALDALATGDERDKLLAACAVSITRIDAMIDLCAATWITDELKAIRAALAASPEVLAAVDTEIESDGSPGWYEAGACWAGSDDGSEIGTPVRVLVLRRSEGE